MTRLAGRRRARGLAVAALAALAALAAAGTGCARRPAAGAEPGPSGGGTRRIDAGIFTDPVRIYQRMGLLAEGGALPFVGAVAYFATPVPDTTHTLVSVSMAASALSFQREGDRYRALYALQLQVRRNDTTLVTRESQEVVRVAGFKETTRDDESVIGQRLLSLPPGFYTLVVTVRDVATQRASTAEVPLSVPRLARPSLSTPIAVLDAAPRGSLDSLPQVVASPRATAVFGRDSLIPVYVEGYATTPAFRVSLAVRSEHGATLWSDTASLPRRGAIFSGLVRIPVSRIGVGVGTLALWPTGAADTVRTPVFVSFGESLPVTTFDEMLQYLRFFTASSRLQALREAPAERRAEAWSRFLADTDPNPQTPEHEALRDYFGRIRTANERFREEGLGGWTSDRGMVFVALGDPDQVYEQGSSETTQRGRAQIWEYRQQGLQLVFIDQTGFGRWRLTSASESDFQLALQRVQENR